MKKPTTMEKVTRATVFFTGSGIYKERTIYADGDKLYCKWYDSMVEVERVFPFCSFKTVLKY